MKPPQQTIPIHTNNLDFAAMRQAGRLAAQVLDYITPFIKEGVSTGKIDRLCQIFIEDHNAIPAPLGYRGYPKATCTSVNHVICHGIPDENKILKNGDIMNLDITVILNGWYGDTSRTYNIGEVNPRTQKLVDVTYDCLMKGIATALPGKTLGDIGHTIQQHAQSHGFSVVRDFCGHGIGQTFHCEPNVAHFGRPGAGPILKPGMFFTIEPMINEGSHHAKVLSDGWTAITHDKKLSAQFEHTIAITETGNEIFTLSPKNYNKPPYPK